MDWRKWSGKANTVRSLLERHIISFRQGSTFIYIFSLHDKKVSNEG